MLKYKFEKHILLEARIYKKDFLTLRVTFTGTDFILSYSSFVLGNFGSQAVAAV